MKALITYTRAATELWIQSRRHDIRVLAGEAKAAAEMLGHDEETGDLLIEAARLLGFAQKIQKLVDDVKEAESEL